MRVGFCQIASPVKLAAKVANFKITIAGMGIGGLEGVKCHQGAWGDVVRHMLFARCACQNQPLMPLFKMPE